MMQVHNGSRQLTASSTGAAFLAIVVSTVVAPAMAAPPPEKRADDQLQSEPGEVRSVSPQAKQLFERALQHLQQEQYAQAAALLEEAASLSDGMGINYQLARCYEELGRDFSAWSRYQRVVRQATSQLEALRRDSPIPTLQMRRLQDRLDVVRKRADNLRSKLISVTLIIPDGLVRLSGTRIERMALGQRSSEESPSIVFSRELWGSTIHLDAGTYRIRVEAPGRQMWSTTLSLSRVGAHYSIPVPELSPLPVPPAPPPEPAPFWTSMRIGGAVMLGLGAIGAGAGIAYASWLSAANPEVNYARIAPLGGISAAGLLSVATGTAMWMSRSTGQQETIGQGITAGLVLSGTGAALQVTW